MQGFYLTGASILISRYRLGSNADVLGLPRKEDHRYDGLFSLLHSRKSCAKYA